MKKRTLLLSLAIVTIIVAAFVIKSTNLFSFSKPLEELPTIAPDSAQWEKALPGRWKITETAFSDDHTNKWIITVEINFLKDHHFSYRASEKYFYCPDGDPKSCGDKADTYIGGTAEGEWFVQDNAFYMSYTSSDFTKTNDKNVYMLSNKYPYWGYGTIDKSSYVSFTKRFSKNEIITTTFDYKEGTTSTCELRKVQ